MKELASSQIIFHCQIKDEGIGIAPEKIKHLFQAFKFSQNDKQVSQGSSTFSATQGVGLGLSTTKSLAQVQGGKVHIRSEVGIHTTFTMTINVQVKRS